MYHVLPHELVHSTGSEKRLGRKTFTETYVFGSEPYSFEELIAEMGRLFEFLYWNTGYGVAKFCGVYPKMAGEVEE